MRQAPPPKGCGEPGLPMMRSETRRMRRPVRRPERAPRPQQPVADPVSEHPLRPLVEPKSIAVVGASAREHTLGHTAVRQALIGGLDGPVHPVNPRYDSILGACCYPSLADLPAPAELAVLALGNERIEAAKRAGREIGFPVALKTAAEGLHHRSDADGVRLALPDEAALEHAYRDLSVRLGPRALVAAMAAPGVEVALGIFHDEQFGPLVMIGAGGVLVEVLDDRRFLLPPVDEAAAARAVEDLRIASLLDGVRGGKAVDRAALCRSVAALGALASALGDSISEVDVNPVIVNAQGCTAVDALVIPRRSVPPVA